MAILAATKYGGYGAGISLELVIENADGVIGWWPVNPGEVLVLEVPQFDVRDAYGGHGWP